MNAVNKRKPGLWHLALCMMMGLVLMSSAVWLIYGGTELIRLGGSWYYLPAGIVLMISGIMIFLRKVAGSVLFFALLIITAAWSLSDADWTFWALTSRLGALVIVGIVIALLTPGMARGRYVRPSLSAAAVLTLAFVFIVWKAFQPVWLVSPQPESQVSHPVSQGNEPNSTGLGRTPDGINYAPFSQITPQNLSRLQVAWTFRTGDIAYGGAENQNTPLQIGDVLYACTPSNKVFALNAVTGKEIWHYDPQINAQAYNPTWQRCRSLAYYELPESAAGGQTSGIPGICRKRIYVTAGDASLRAVDASSGKLCEDFGQGGIVRLSRNMGEIIPGSYYQTSGAVIAGDRLIVGGYVIDNQTKSSPSGVVRAFNAVSGSMEWAWDTGRPGQHGLPAEGQTFTPGTPNVWSVPTYDSELNLVYLPVGGTGTDMFGGLRTAEDEKVTSSVVALDANTGEQRWVFQTTHHDVWDYDVPSKPVLYAFPDKDGRRVPALIQTTKRGQIFVLDRRTGKPLTEVTEKAVPVNGVPEEKLSPTQPYSTGMPAVRSPLFTEGRTWGLTPLDQLSCRIAFKQARYQGEFTPPGIDWYLPDPSPLGGMNWGGVSIDTRHDYLIVNDMRLMMKARLIPRKNVEGELARTNKMTPSVHGIIPMEETPYGADRIYINSPLGIPCTTPPFGTLTAIDMKTRKIAWQRSMGTPEQFGPLNIRAHLPVEMGMPTLGAGVTTASGLVFYYGTSDYYLRAMDSVSGKELWKSPLPVGGQGTPLVYQSQTDGNEYVVVTAGGSRGGVDRGDYIIAYRLSDKK